MREPKRGRNTGKDQREGGNVHQGTTAREGNKRTTHLEKATSEQHIGRRQGRGERDRKDASRGEDGDNRDDPRRPASGREERAGGREECGAPQRVARASLLPGPPPKGHYRQRAKLYAPGGDGALAVPATTLQCCCTTSAIRYRPKQPHTGRRAHPHWLPVPTLQESTITTGEHQVGRAKFTGILSPPTHTDST